MRVLRYSQLRKCLNSSPPKIPKALFKSPIIFLLSPGPYPSSPPWLALPPVHCPSPHSVLATSSLEPVNTACSSFGKQYFIFILSSPQSKSCRSSHQTLLPSLLLSWQTLSTSEAALALGSWQLNWWCHTAQPTHQKGGITLLFANIAYQKSSQGHVQPFTGAACAGCGHKWCPAVTTAPPSRNAPLWSPAWEGFCTKMSTQFVLNVEITPTGGINIFLTSRQKIIEDFH